MTTAIYRDSYAGDVPVKLVRHGKGWLWTAPGYVECGYRPTATPERAIANARADRRFTDIREG